MPCSSTILRSKEVLLVIADGEEVGLWSVEDFATKQAQTLGNIWPDVEVNVVFKNLKTGKEIEVWKNEV